MWCMEKRRARSTFSSSVNVSSLSGSNGFKIVGANANQLFGFDADGLGDINGDGRGDLIIAEGPGVAESTGFVIFGNPVPSGTFQLSSLDGTNGFSFKATTQTNLNAMFVSKAGDVNGDGLNDVLVGMASSQVDDVTVPGGAFVLYGSDSAYGNPLVLDTVDGTDGFRFEGMNDLEFAGEAVSGDVDLNGDGLKDIVVGAWLASPNGVDGAGEAYAVFGRGKTVTPGSGPINETLDLGKDDQVTYTIAAEIAGGATGSTVVNASATKDPADTDTNADNDTDSETTTINGAPRITDVILAGQLWGATFIDTVDGGSDGTGNGLGLSMPGTNQLDILPWVNVDRIYLWFSEDMGNFSASDFTLVGTNHAPVIQSVAYDSDPDNDTSTTDALATITLQAPIPNDRMLLSIDDALTSAQGVALNGEWTDAVSLISGDSTAGGDFHFRFNVLPGDVNQNGVVIANDTDAVFAAEFTFVGGPVFNPLTDP